jgi:hypothetical protein
MSANPYPLGFAIWPEDRRNEFFAEEARKHRATRNGGADAAQRLPRPGVKGGSVSFVGSPNEHSPKIIGPSRSPLSRRSRPSRRSTLNCFPTRCGTMCSMLLIASNRRPTLRP